MMGWEQCQQKMLKIESRRMYATAWMLELQHAGYRVTDPPNPYVCMRFISP